MKKLVIISHTAHQLDEMSQVVGWGPTIREINFISKNWDEVVHVACLEKGYPLGSSLAYSENNTRFYALQQDYLMYNIERLGGHHVSLAYRINRPFTEEEIEYANSMVPIDTICENEMYVSLNDCRSCLPKHWNQLKRHVF